MRYKKWKQHPKTQANWVTLEPTAGYRAGQINLTVRYQVETAQTYRTREFETMIDLDEVAMLVERARKIADTHIEQLQQTRRRLG